MLFYNSGFPILNCLIYELKTIKRGENSLELFESRFQKIYCEHADTVYRLCFMFLRGHTMDAEDALQSTFLKLIRSLKAGDDIHNVKAWLTTCAANTCKNILNRSYRQDIKLDDVYTKADYRDETLELILGLPKYERLSLYLHYYEGYTAQEIGRMLGKRDTSVWSYLHKGRSKLKKLLTEDIQSESFFSESNQYHCIEK